MTSQSLDDFIAKSVAGRGRSERVTFIPEPDREPLFCPIISVDDHALEPSDMFEGRLPARFADRAPRVEIGDMDAPWWVIDGKRIPILLANGTCGREMSEWGSIAASYDEMRRAVWDPSARLHDMDISGVWASLCFGSIVWGFAGTRFSQIADPALGLACLRAYNDWMLEEWCGAAPDRYIPCQLSWLRDAEVAALEVQRNAKRGFRAVSFSENPEGLGFPNIYDRSWDPFFRACEETQTVVNLHVGSSGTTKKPCSSSAEPVSTALFPVSGLEALIDWIYAGIPMRFPNLVIALSEAGASWVPMAIERLGRAYRQSSVVGKEWPGGIVTPQEIVARNFVFTSIEDPSAFHNLDLIGEDNVMVETDFPHLDSTWPHSQAMIRSELGGIAPDVARKVCYGNAARIYRFSPPPVSLIAGSEVGLPVRM
jgi:predicted TIM-barrel fold metal-dependent hydrolase